MNSINEKLARGDVSMGTWMQIADASVAQMMGSAGYDWVAVDLEHGDALKRDLAGIFRALELGGTLPFARISDTHPTQIKQALDSGAKGLIYPMIESAEQLETAIWFSLYPPEGKRGVGYSRTNGFGQYFDSYLESANEITLVAQIEDIKAVGELEKILSVPGLSAIIVGPYDLSGSMGLTGQFDHPDFIETMDNIFKLAKQFRIPMGTHIVQPDRSMLEQRIAEGYQFIAYGIDAVFLYGSAANPRQKTDK